MMMAASELEAEINKYYPTGVFASMTGLGSEMMFASKPVTELFKIEGGNDLSILSEILLLSFPPINDRSQRVENKEGKVALEGLLQLLQQIMKNHGGRLGSKDETGPQAIAVFNLIVRLEEAIKAVASDGEDEKKPGDMWLRNAISAYGGKKNSELGEFGKDVDESIKNRYSTTYTLQTLAALLTKLATHAKEQIAIAEPRPKDPLGGGALAPAGGVEVWETVSEELSTLYGLAMTDTLTLWRGVPEDDLFQKMRKEKIPPGTSTFVSVVNGIVYTEELGENGIGCRPGVAAAPHNLCIRATHVEKDLMGTYVATIAGYNPEDATQARAMVIFGGQWMTMADANEAIQLLAERGDYFSLETSHSQTYEELPLTREQINKRMLDGKHRREPLLENLGRKAETFAKGLTATVYKLPPPTEAAKKVGQHVMQGVVRVYENTTVSNLRTIGQEVLKDWGLRNGVGIAEATITNAPEVFQTASAFAVSALSSAARAYQISNQMLGNMFWREWEDLSSGRGDITGFGVAMLASLIDYVHEVWVGGRGWDSSGTLKVSTNLLLAHSIYLSVAAIMADGVFVWGARNAQEVACIALLGAARLSVDLLHSYRVQGVAGDDAPSWLSPTRVSGQSGYAYFFEIMRNTLGLANLATHLTHHFRQGMDPLQTLVARLSEGMVLDGTGIGIGILALALAGVGIYHKVGGLRGVVAIVPPAIATAMLLESGVSTLLHGDLGIDLMVKGTERAVNVFGVCAVAAFLRPLAEKITTIIDTLSQDSVAARFFLRGGGDRAAAGGYLPEVRFGERSGAAAGKLVRVPDSASRRSVEPEAHVRLGVPPALVAETFYDVLAIIGVLIDSVSKAHATSRATDAAHKTIIDHAAKPPHTLEEYRDGDEVPKWTQTLNPKAAISVEAILARGDRAAEAARAYLIGPLSVAGLSPMLGVSLTATRIADTTSRRSSRDPAEAASSIYPPKTLAELLALVDLAIGAHKNDGEMYHGDNTVLSMIYQRPEVEVVPLWDLDSIYDLTVLQTVTPEKPYTRVYIGYVEHDEHAMTFYYATCTVGGGDGAARPSFVGTPSVDGSPAVSAGVVARRKIFPRPWWIFQYPEGATYQQRHEPTIGSQIWDVWRLLSALKAEDACELSGKQMWSAGDGDTLGKRAAACAENIIGQIISSNGVTAGLNVHKDDKFMYQDGTIGGKWFDYVVRFLAANAIFTIRMRSHSAHSNQVLGDVPAKDYRAAHDTAHRLYGPKSVGPPVPPLVLQLFTVALGVEFALTQFNARVISTTIARTKGETIGRRSPSIKEEWADAFADA
jgi:hypothetical protein